MKFLVLGAGGMAGHTIVNYLLEQNHEVTGFARKKLNYCKTIVGDALEKETIKKLLTSNNYDYIINCIGVLNKDVDEDLENGIYLNSYLPHFIAKCIKGTESKLVHISTDCVFSGKESGDYTESSFKSADSFYGRSKALGEINDNKNLTIRTSIIGPDIKEEGIGLFNWFMKQNGSINGFSSVNWTGVTTIQLAKAIEETCKQNVCGLYNLVNNQKINKYDLLCLFNSMRSEKINIIENDNIISDKSLVNTREDFNFRIPAYEDMINEMKEWIINHKELYQHYKIY